jgi:hypothetical protein
MRKQNGWGVSAAVITFLLAGLVTGVGCSDSDDNSNGGGGSGNPVGLGAAGTFGVLAANRSRTAVHLMINGDLGIWSGNTLTEPRQ